MLNKKALAASVSAAPKVYVEDVFATSSYRGTNATLTITNDIDLSGKGGLVWTKIRSGTTGHRLTDTARGTTKSLESNSTAAEATESTGLTAFNANGFTIGNDADYNTSSQNYIAWTFRKQAKFFDVVTYTGTGVARTVSHNLGSVPGCIIVKRTDTTADWQVFHRIVNRNRYLVLNSTAAQATGADRWDSTDPTSTVFSLGTSSDVNASGGTYVAYLFAHNAGGFGDSGSDNIITCGSYTGNNSVNGPTITLGYEPQWILIKQATNSGTRWTITDNMRGFPVTSAANQQILQPDVSDAEVGVMYIQPTSTGFKVVDVDADVNESGSTYIYIAIRRGPMKTPTDATKVFTPTVYTGTNVDNRRLSTTITPDFVMIRQRDDTVVPGMYTGARLTSQEFLITGSTNAGATDADSFDADNPSVGGVPTEFGDAWSLDSTIVIGNDATRKFNANTTSNNHIIEAFKRAPGFMDVVCYTGTGANRTVTHNLGVAPEMMWVKARNTTGAWTIYHSTNGNTKYARFNDSGVPATDSTMWNNTSPTSSTFALGTNSDVNQNTSTYIAVLFASCSGISKIGSYTGNGTSQTINCGFTNGTRFVLIKRTDDTGDWPIFDSARGIVAAEDPYFLLNANTAEIAGLRDAVDSTSSGFIVNETTGPNINTNNATYIYLAIA